MLGGLVTQLERSPIVAAVKSEAQLDAAIASPCSVIFLLCGDICTVGELVERAKAGGKCVIVHVDLIAGLSREDVAVDFIRRFTRADGVISTRPNLVRRAKELGLFSVLRVFVIDSMALGNVARQTAQSAPDVIEILPGVMPKVVKRLREEVRLPLVVGGLVADKEDVMAALSAGALAVSTTDEKLWAE